MARKNAKAGSVISRRWGSNCKKHTHVRPLTHKEIARRLDLMRIAAHTPHP